MEIQESELTAIRPYPDNPRIITPEAVEQVAESIRLFGFRQPIVVDEESVIIVGHVRRLAAMRLGLDTVPVHVAEGLTPEQVASLRLVDNRTGELAYWDEALLAGELSAVDGDPEKHLVASLFDANEFIPPDVINAGDVAPPVAPDGVGGTQRGGSGRPLPVECPRCGHEWELAEETESDAS